MKTPSRLTILRWIVAGLILAGTALWLPRLARQARTATAMAVVDDAAKRLDAALPVVRPGDRDGYPVVVVMEGDAGAFARQIRSRLESAPALKVGHSGHPLVADLDLESRPAQLTLTLTLEPAEARPVVVRARHGAISPWSVLPPLLAIVLAFATGRLVLSLLASILLGGLIAVGPNPLAFTAHAADVYFWEATFTDPFKLWIIVFTLALLGLVQLATRAGGVQGIVDRIAALARSARSTQISAVLMGVAIFFDDYANTILVGSTMRPLTDRMRVSREKLAYVVDSTSAPVAGIAIISTWIGYEVGLFTDLSHSLGLAQDGYQLFFAALPFRFYCMFTLVFLAFLVWSGRDYGPMLRAERRAERTGEVIRPGAIPLASRTFGLTGPRDGIPHLAHVALLPIGVVLAGALLGLLWDGGGLAKAAASPLTLLSFVTWRDAFGAAEHSTFVLAMASLAGSVVALALVLGRRLLRPREALRAYGRGMAAMYLAVVILLLAWGIKAVTDDLGTSWFLVAGLQDVVSPSLLPMVVFLLAALVSFATGTSWGTMGILIPTAVPLAWHLGGPGELFITAAAVLDGAIFGDHVSPISDTTVMSSIASGSDHLDHVRTQAPYALTTMLSAALFGYLWDAAGLPYWLGWVASVGFLAATIRVLGRKVRVPAPEAEEAPESSAA